MSLVRLIAIVLLSSSLLFAHENKQRNLKPTKAQSDLKRARKKLDSAKKMLAEQGRYKCCVKPTCDLCMRVNGSCNCAANAAAGKGSCGECYLGLKSGRGTVKPLRKDPLAFLASDQQQMPGNAVASPDLHEAIASLTRAKRTLVSEKRYSCCIRGGCMQCAFETTCPCASDLARQTGAGTSKEKATPTGVCGECVDGWHTGHGAFPGIAPSEVTFADMPSMDDSMAGPGGGQNSGWYSSGTSQTPREAPMPMLQKSAGNWRLGLHGVAFGVFTDQSGPRGRDKIFSTNWFMPMASRRLGPGMLTLRAMLSLEPATITRRFYPELFQGGETANGIPIINGQHPHDFFMELAASYQFKFSDRTSLNFYGGARGEPALGPSAFPHRISGSENPLAVLGHHSQDSTHIANNVVTLGLTHGPVTLEASGFHGREPDEARWGLELGAIDSFASRITITPTRRWSGQFSIGRINKREQIHPQRPSFRQTASIIYVRALETGHWATSIVWGRNHDLEYTQPPNVPQNLLKGSARTSLAQPTTIYWPQHIVSVPTRIPGEIYNTYLAESTLRFKNRNWIWGRIESTDRDSLLLFEMAPFVLFAAETHFTRVQAFTGGYERDLPRVAKWLNTGLGGQFTVYNASKRLAPIYGAHPVAAQIFLRMRLGGEGQ